jgi:integrase
MKLSESGSRGVFWRGNPRGTQDLRGSGGRRERGDWWVRWACPYGHLHRALVGPKSLARQESERRRLERPCPARQPKPSTYLLGDVIDDYLEASKSHKRSWKDDARYGKAWKARFPGRALDEILSAELEKIRTERLAAVRGKNKATGRPITPATVNREFAFLKHVYNVAIRDGKIDRNAVARLKMLREPSGRVRYLNDDEEARLMKALASDADRQRVTVLLQTGLRKSEFLGLRWKDIDLKVGGLTIPRSKNGEARHVPLTSTVRAIFSRLPRTLDASGLVFPNAEGNRDLRWAEKTFPRVVADANIEDFRLHDTRHTFASRLAMEGVDLLAIKDLGGWKSLAMVQRYAHLSPSHRSQAIERLVTRHKPAEKHEATGTE